MRVISWIMRVMSRLSSPRRPANLARAVATAHLMVTAAAANAEKTAELRANTANAANLREKAANAAKLRANAAKTAELRVVLAAANALRVRNLTPSELVNDCVM